MGFGKVRGPFGKAAACLAAALAWGMAPTAFGEEFVWVGYQYGSPGPPGDGWWRTDASWFHADNWRNYNVPEGNDPAIPREGDLAVFDDREDDFIPHRVHFGDFTVSADPPGLNQPLPIAGGDARARWLDVRDGDYTFDFSQGSGSTQGSLAVDQIIRVGTLSQTFIPGDASLTIVGGRLSQTAPDSGSALIVGDGFGTSGRLVVQGPGAEVDLIRDASIGNGGGEGSLEVRDGGVFRSNAIGSGAYYGPNRELSTTRIAADGAGSEIIGLANVNNGTLAITNGGHVSTKMGDGTLGWAFLGTTDGARAEALVDGNGSRWDEIGRLTVGGVYHTDTNAQGELAIRNGGVVEADGLVVGDRRARGEVTIDGDSSALRIAGGSLVGAGQGTGSLALTRGAVFETRGINVGAGGGTGTLSADGGSEIRIGTDSLALGWDDSSGELTLSGGSRLVDAGLLIVGNVGSGEMTIEGGSTAESRDGLIGSDGGRGVATIQGQGSRWDMAGSLQVGGSVGRAGDGTGLLVVQDGGVATVSSLVLTWSGGTIDVHDGGRMLVGAGDVEAVSDGTLQVGAGGTLGGDGTIVGDVVVDGGSIAPGHSPGLLTIDGGLSLLSGVLRMEIGGATAGLYDRLVVTGDVALGGLLILDFINGYTADYGLMLDLISSGGLLSGSFREVLVWNMDPSRVSIDASGGAFSIQVAPTAVPEPTSWALMGLGTLIAAAAARRRRAA